MQIFNLVKERLERISPVKVDFSVERPKNKKNGDLATNLALILAKEMKSNPLNQANELLELLKKDPELNNLVEKFELAPPGFINFYLKDTTNYLFLEKLQRTGTKAFDGFVKLGNNKKINLEFCSANPTGPLHLGHARSAIFGSILARILEEVGYQVTKEYYINDSGSQIDILVKSLYIRYRQEIGDQVSLPDGCYPGSYLIEVAKKMREKFGDKLEFHYAVKNIRIFALEEIMKLIKEDLSKLGVEFDLFTSEENLLKSGLVEEALSILEEQNLIYHGVLEKPKGKVEEWDAREQLLFRSKRFGDELDRPLVKSDGSYAYFAPDLALHLEKLRRGYDKMILILGADHGGYVSRIKAAVSALSGGTKDIEILLNQLVNLYKGGQLVRMSKRKGNFITVEEVLEELPAELLTFAMMMQKNGTILDLDCDKLLEQSKDNPLFYINYAHTRVASLIRKTYEKGFYSEEEISIKEGDPYLIYHFNPKEPIKYQLLDKEEELDLIKFFMEYPKILEQAALHYEPHRINYYLYDLANKLHNLWQEGVSDHSRKAITEDKDLTRARVSLFYTGALLIGLGLELFGIKPQLEM
jgi:arginyl-tRNA synthetase